MNAVELYRPDVLAALHAHRGQPGQDAQERFTKHDLQRWCDGRVDMKALERIVYDLSVNGLIRRQLTQRRAKDETPAIAFYSLTEQGRAAASQAPQPVKTIGVGPSSRFPCRLWALLRIRGMLTASEAAELLVDAGDDPRRAMANAADWLRAWARVVPDHVQVSKRMVGGCKRYVLVKDLGPTPPARGVRA